MQRLRLLGCTLAISASLGFVSSVSLAQTDGAAASGDSAQPENVDPSARWKERAQPLPRDTVGGHFNLGVTGGFVVPFGTASSETNQRHLLGNGWSGALDLSYGVSRTVSFGAYGQALFLGDGSRCTDCEGQSFSGGLFVRYHLAQGLRFDPWVSYGLGFRTQSATVDATKLSYSGLDWARVQIGGDWYALSQFGFGPLVEFTGGSFFSRPDGDGGAGVHLQVLVGLRTVLDLPGK
jgi:hypothetical protein